MNSKFTIILSAALMAGTSVFAQKVTDKEISFEYKRLPLEPLGVTFTNFQSKVELNYLAENEAMLKEYEKQVLAAEEQYQIDLKEWEEKDKEAEKKYQSEMEEYNKKSGAQKLLEKKILEESKPAKQMISKPVKQEPQKPMLKKEHDPSLIANSYLNLEGFNKKSENAVVVTASLYGFEAIAPQMKTASSSQYSNGQSNTVNTYFYETSFRFPVAIKVEVPGKGVVFNQAIEDFSEYTITKTPASKSTAFPNANMNLYLQDLEEKALADNMKYVNELVNNKFAVVKLKRDAIIYNVDHKKVDYNDYTAAFENAIIGFNMLASNKEEGAAKIQLAIQAWEKALTEEDLKDKKARINTKVATITRLNLAEAYTWIDEYTKAEMQLVKLNVLDPSRKQKAYAEELSSLIKDQKQRFDANKNM